MHDLYDLDNIPDYLNNLFISFFRSRPLEYSPPEEIADTCSDTRAARLASMEQALDGSACSFRAWVPDSQDIEDEEEIVLSR